MYIVEQLKKALDEMGVAKAEALKAELAIVKASLETAHNEVTAAQAAVAECREAVQAQNKVVDQLNETLTAKEAEITALKAELATEKAKTEEVISSMGVTVTQIPTAGSTTGTEPTGSSLVLQLEKITDPTERAAFRKKHFSALYRALNQPK